MKVDLRVQLLTQYKSSKLLRGPHSSHQLRAGQIEAVHHVGNTSLSGRYSNLGSFIAFIRYFSEMLVVLVPPVACCNLKRLDKRACLWPPGRIVQKLLIPNPLGFQAGSNLPHPIFWGKEPVESFHGGTVKRASNCPQNSSQSHSLSYLAINQDIVGPRRLEEAFSVFFHLCRIVGTPLHRIVVANVHTSFHGRGVI